MLKIPASTRKKKKKIEKNKKQKMSFGSSRRGVVGDVYHYGKKLGRSLGIFKRKNRGYAISSAPRKAPRIILPINRGPSVVVSGSGSSRYDIWSEKKVKEMPSSMTYYIDDAGFTTDLRLLNGIEEGTAIDRRVGRKVKNLTCLIKGRLNSPSDYSSTRVRLMVIYDTQCNGEAPALADVLTGSTPNLIDSFYNMNYRDRFRMLADKVYVMNPIDSTHQRFVNFRIPLNLTKCETTYSDTGPLIDAIATGSLYFVAISDNATAGTDATKAHISFTYRLRYNDK